MTTNLNLTTQEKKVLEKILEKRKGTYMKICSKKNLEPLKKYESEFTEPYKLATYLCRYGVRVQNMNSYKDKKVKELQEQALEMAKEITQTFKLTDRERSNIRKAMICTMAIEQDLVIAATEK